MLSVPHMVVIFLVALVVLGPEKLPQVARTLGRIMAEFRRITGDFRYQIEHEMRDMERHANAKTAQAEEAAAHGMAPYETAEETAFQGALTHAGSSATSAVPPAPEVAPPEPQQPPDGQSRPN